MLDSGTRAVPTLVSAHGSFACDSPLSPCGVQRASTTLLCVSRAVICRDIRCPVYHAVCSVFECVSVLLHLCSVCLQSWTHSQVRCRTPVCVLASAPVGLVADGQSTATSIPLGFSPPTLRSMQLLGSSSARGGGDFQLTGQGKGTVLCCVALLRWALGKHMDPR